MPWHLIDTPPAPGAFNMALDQALMESVRAGAPPVLRFYRWSPACLSLGRNQPAAGLYDEAEIRRRGIDVVRRPTGGRAVLHDRELTYAAVFPDRLLGTPRAAYASINLALVDGLKRLGVEAALQPATAARAPAPSTAPCFRDPAEGEVVIGGRKLIGSAQYREDGVVLQHGSLLLSGDQAPVADLLYAAAETDRAAALDEHIDPLPSWSDLTAALASAWARSLATDVVPRRPADAEAARADELARTYAGVAWTWRK